MESDDDSIIHLLNDEDIILGDMCISLPDGKLTVGGFRTVPEHSFQLSTGSIAKIRRECAYNRAPGSVQCCFMNSTATQCDPILVTQGVQYEPPLLVSQSVQCELPLQMTQGVECETINRVSQESKLPSEVQDILADWNVDDELDELHKSTSVSNNVNNESNISPSKPQGNSEDLHFVTITSAPLHEELDVVTSQRVVCTSSSSSSSSSENTRITVVREVPDELNVHRSSIEDQVSSSKAIPSISNMLKKKKGMKYIKKMNKKRLVIPYDVSTPSIRKEEKSGREYCTSSGKCGDKSDAEYTVEELLLEMANKKCEDACIGQSMVERNGNKRRGWIAVQKNVDTSSRQHLSSSGRRDERLGKECSEDLLHEGELPTSEGASGNKNKMMDSGEVENQHVVARKVLGPPSVQPETSRRKLCSDANDTVVSSKSGVQLVPYSDSSSDSESSDCDNTSESSMALSRRIEQKHRKKKTRESSTKIQRTASIRVARSNSAGSSAKKRLTSFSDSCTSESVGVQKKMLSKQESPAKSGFIKIRRTNAENTQSNSGSESAKKRPACLSIWSSDDDDDDDVSILSRAKSSTSVKTGRNRTRAPYREFERESILWFIIDHTCYKLVKGIALWQRMEKEKVCPGRTWQSMKEHFIKKILPQIDTFHLDPIITKKFISIRK